MNLPPQSYGPAVVALLSAAKQNDLGPGAPDTSHRAALAALTPESIVAPHRLADLQMAQACLAGLWLRFDFLDESHRISQDLETSTGSYWHGIMHRREPDYGNAKYWFRRVGNHPVYEPLARASRELRGQVPGAAAKYHLDTPEWNALGFVDLCEQAQRDAPLAALCREIQEREWELLFADCFRRAQGSAA